MSALLVTWLFQPKELAGKLHDDLTQQKLASLDSAKAFVKMLRSFRNSGTKAISEVFSSPDSYYIVYVFLHSFFILFVLLPLMLLLLFIFLPHLMSKSSSAAKFWLLIHFHNCVVKFSSFDKILLLQVECEWCLPSAVNKLTPVFSNSTFFCITICFLSSCGDCSYEEEEIILGCGLPRFLQNLIEWCIVWELVQPCACKDTEAGPYLHIATL